MPRKNPGRADAISGISTTERCRIARPDAASSLAGIGIMLRKASSPSAFKPKELAKCISLPSNRTTNENSPPTELHGALCDRIKDRLNIRRRAGNDAQHFGGCRLLLQRLPQLAKQPRILDCDYCLVGEVGDQLDLPFGEWPDFGSYERQDADRDTLAQHRHAECRARHFPQFDQSVFRICFHVADLDHSAFEQGSPADRTSVGLDRKIFDVIDNLRRDAIKFGAVKDSIDLPRGYGHVGVTEFCSRLDERLQHRFEIERRATNALEHVGSGGLLLK